MYNVLIVEDNPTYQRMINDILKTLNLNMLFSTTVNEALSISLEKEIDLFIIDIYLNNKETGIMENGFDLAKELRKTYINTPIIIESVISDLAVKANVHDEIENTAFLTKPFSPDKLKKKVKSALSPIEKTNTNRLFLNYNKVYWEFNVREIIYIERIKNEKGVCITSLNELNGQLENTDCIGITLKDVLEKHEEDICQCHKSILINFSQTRTVNLKKNFIRLRHVKDDIPIGDKYWQKIKERVDDKWSG